MFQWIKSHLLKQTRFKTTNGLTIRKGLLLGYSAVASIMILATSFALFSTDQVSKSMSVILDKRLPAMLQSSAVAKAVNELAITGTSFQSVKNEDDFVLVNQEFSKAVLELNDSLKHMNNIVKHKAHIRNVSIALTENIEKLRTLTKQRIVITQESQFAREKLLSNLQTFKQNLTYRVRIIEADSDLISYLLSLPSPPIERIINLTKKSAKWFPVQRFYREVEALSRYALTIIEDPSIPSLDISSQIISNDLLQATTTFDQLPAEISVKLNQTFLDLKNIILGDSGLIALREKELLLELVGQNLINENKRFTTLVDEGSSNLLQQEIAETQQAGSATEKLRQKYMFLLLLATFVGLFSIGALMYFYLIRNIISRLSWLSNAMQSIAAGKLDTPLPPAGNDEIGRLSITIRQFQQTAFEAEQREADLRLSNEKVEIFNADLKQKTLELEVMNNKLEKLSITDFLTGLANRRCFDESLEVEWTRAQRTSQPLALIMVDVDHFKKFNDKYGHQAGDKCLKKVADTLIKNVSRAGELVARYGGEEFCIIAPNTDSSAAYELAEKIRLAVQALSLKNEDTPKGILTISLGIASCIPKINNKAKTLISVADKALYEAKSHGRNQVGGKN